MKPKTNPLLQFLGRLTDKCECLLEVAFVLGAPRADPEEGLERVVGRDARVQGQRPLVLQVLQHDVGRVRVKARDAVHVRSHVLGTQPVLREMPD